MESRPIIFHRSGAVSDWHCPRSRFYGYEIYGRGISPPETQLSLYLGTLIHDGVAAMVHNVPIEKIVEAGVRQLRAKLLEGRGPHGPKELDSDAQYFAEEQCALAEGLLRGFYRARWPQICEAYPEVVLCEKELVYDYEIDGQQLRFLSKPDLVRRDKEGNLWVFEWKTTSSNKEEWIHQWETAVQVHAQIKTIETALGEPVAGCIVQGFYKSYVSQWNRLESIFAYAYHKPGEPPFSKPIWAYEYKAGLRKSPIWQREGGVKQWVEEMPIPLLASQFPCTPPIFVKDRLVDAFFKQQGHREVQINDFMEQTHPDDEGYDEMLGVVFPQHFESCNAWSRPCSFKRLCFGADVVPLSIGYTLRHSHHELEEQALNESSTTAQ